VLVLTMMTTPTPIVPRKSLLIISLLL